VTDPVRLRFPFTGRWMAMNSPADGVPSHGTHLFGTTYAIDFVAVDDRGRTGRVDWRTLVATEPPERFLAFGRPILSPVSGTVVAAHDGEPDHEATRSAVRGIPYLLSQGRRAAQGISAVAGNHVVVALRGGGPYVLVAHLRRRSLEVGVGDTVEAGTRLGACGNSGNSTQPHVHVQATDSLAWESARGLPIAFSGGVDAATGEPVTLPRNRRPLMV
jgi:hypothetical protein